MATLNELVKKAGVYVDEKDLDKYGYLSASINSINGHVHIRMNPANSPSMLHRVLLNPPANMQVDHINRNPSDNRRLNLRLATNSQNQANKGLSSNNTSGYKGVSYNKGARKFRAYIKYNAGNYHLGFYSTAEGAAKAYNRRAVELHGEFACLNIIPEGA